MRKSPEQVFVFAASPHQFTAFCREQEIPPSKATHINRPDKLDGIDGRGEKIICLPGCETNDTYHTIIGKAKARGFRLIIAGDK